MEMNTHHEHVIIGSVPMAGSLELLRRYLSEAGRCRVDLIPTRNRVSMISVVFVRNGHVRLRLHEQFLSAPLPVRDALATFLRTHSRAAWSVVAAYARGICVPPVTMNTPLRKLSTQGQFHDLGKIAEDVNAQHFNGRIMFRLGWGARRRTQRRRRARSRSIRYGSWSESTRTIRINPLLDDIRVPREFVAYIVYHEMLHAAVPAELIAGRRRDHGPVFRKFEKQYPDIERMRKMSKELLSVLLDG